MANMKDILDEIIRKRGSQAVSKKDRKNELKRKKEKLGQLKEIYVQLSKLDDEQQELMCGSRETAAELQNSETLVEQCLECCEKAIQEAERLQTRFERKTIDLVVVGKVGAGKSRFLQSASGLGNDCIPALRGDSCTGVSSVIENISDTGKTEAHFLFKSEEDIKKDIIREIENTAVRLQKLVPAGETVTFDGELSGLEIEEIEFCFGKVLRETEKILKSSQGTIQTRAQTLLDEVKFRKGEFTIKEKRAEWLPYVGDPKEKNAYLDQKEWSTYTDEKGRHWYVLTDPEQIKLFVSKHGGAGKEYHRYIAVKEAVIKTHITGTDARVRLVDTVGIGDPAADTVQRVHDAVRNESDGMIFLSPNRDRNANHTGIDEEDVPLYETLRDLYAEHMETDARFWMAFIQNHRKSLDNPDDPEDQEGRKYSENYIKKLESTYRENDDMFGGNGICYRKVVDVTSAEEVSAMLKEFLLQISAHLDSIDRCLEAKLEDLCRQVREQELKIQFLAERIQSRIRTPQALSDDCLYRLTDDRLDQLDTKLKEYKLSIMKKKRDMALREPSFLQQRIGLVRKLWEGETLEEIHTDLETMIDEACKNKVEIAAVRARAWISLKRAVRKIAVYPCAAQKQTEEEYKNRIADILIQSLCMDLKKAQKQNLIASDEKAPDFFEKAGEMLFGFYDAEELRDIFVSMAGFRLDEMNALTKALFYHYAQECLTDDPYGMRQKSQNAALENEEVFFPEDDESMEDALWNEYNDEEKEGERKPDERDRYHKLDGKDQYFSEEAKSMLKKELRSRLELFIKELEKNAGNETYLVGSYDQMDEELDHFMQITDEKYRRLWDRSIRKLKEQGIIKEDVPGEERQRVLEEAAGKISSCLSDVQSLL